MNNNNFISRAAFIFFLYYLGFLVLIINLFRIQVIQNQKWSKIAYRQYFTKEEVSGKRGKILTFNGKEIAYDMESYQLILDPKFIEEKDISYIAEAFSVVLGLDYEKIKNDITDKKNAGRRYIKIGEGLLAKEKNEITNMLIKGKTRKEQRDILAGIFFKEDTTRIYPELDLFKNVIGYINSEKQGVYGIEKTYDNYLKGGKGYSQRFLSTHNQFNIPVLNDPEKMEAEDGNNIYLTIDYVIQHILDESLYEIFIETEADWAAAIVISPKNGKVLAMSSFPVSQNKQTVRNNVIYNQYEPGSVFKAIIMSMALEEKLVNENEIFYSKGWIKMYNVTMKDHDSSTTGYLDIAKIIEKSSNVAMVMISERFSNFLFYEYLKKFGFDEKTNIELSGEREIKIRPYKRWSGVTKATMSFGQGIVATPIQMAMAFAAVINGGYLYEPMIVDRVETSSGKLLKKNEPILKRRVFASNDTTEKMIPLLKRVVDSGTAKNAYIEGYEVAGKTGTSQKAGPKGYEKGKYISSFAGFFPANDPEYLCLVVVDEPKGKKIYGGQVAAPVVKNTFERIIRHKNITPKNIKDKIIYIGDEELDINFDVIEVDENIMPDLKGKSLKEALNFFHEKDYEIVVKGSGMIKNQEPKAGSDIKDIKKIYITLE